MEYKVIKTNRRTIAIYIREDGEVEVRAPKYVDNEKINSFVEEKYMWIEKTQKKLLEKKENKIIISAEMKQKLIDEANTIILERVGMLSKKMGVHVEKIKITSAHSYWGCCNKKHELSFSWRLMLATYDTIDYVIIHELSHTKYYNHSNNFWKEVEKYCPLYKENKMELKNIQKKYE